MVTISEMNRIAAISAGLSLSKGEPSRMPESARLARTLNSWG